MTQGNQPTGAISVGDDLRIKRHFTTEGVHPYDEIEWELRDAIIQNYRTGEVAFEQRDVEVPKAWSQNATNIAAQKYFRGSLGTPERERSVKQMIDRVVNRYTEEGLERGYFADDDEAQTFKDELTHLLVNQKAAFNSPVWFNVGWRPKGEEQVSACQPYHSLVSTPSGLVPIGKLVEENAVGHKVFDAEGITRIVAVKANGTKDVLRIHTKAGYTLDVTEDHLAWKRNGERSGKFVQAGELRAGDALEWHRVESFGDDEITIEALRAAAQEGSSFSNGVPAGLFTTPLPILAAYLRTAFDEKASVLIAEDSPRVKVELGSMDLARDLQRLLVRFGIFAEVTSKSSLLINELGDRVTFRDEIGFGDPTKAERLERGLAIAGLPTRDTKELQIARVERLGPMKVYDIQTESGEYLSDNLRVHNCFILS
ncbi:MAG: ribonucleoside-diphosphate reductase, partial [Actinomycetota bacterium]|nr:ribonucleoside-diphosphate reductase [Actinomycetota bacterium]